MTMTDGEGKPMRRTATGELITLKFGKNDNERSQAVRLTKECIGCCVAMMARRALAGALSYQRRGHRLISCCHTWLLRLVHPQNQTRTGGVLLSGRDTMSNLTGMEPQLSCDVSDPGEPSRNSTYARFAGGG